MRAPNSAPMMCRVLLRLDRAKASGTLRLLGEGHQATLSLEDRLIVGANIDRRVPSSNRQLLQGMRDVCEWYGLVLRLTDVPAATTWWKLDEPLPARTLALGLVRAAVEQVDATAAGAELGSGTVHLTEAGEALIADATLRPEETAVISWLRRGVRADDILALPGCGLRGYRFAWMLKLIGAAAPKRGGSYPLLLRKRREVRQRASARTLLDLDGEATAKEARRALRKLVRDLHPDRFGESAPAALRRASGEIVSALVTAEAAIRAGAAD